MSSKPKQTRTEFLRFLRGSSTRGVFHVLNRKKAKHAEPKYTMPYNERIRNYNAEKQSALILATNQDEVDRIITYLRKKWSV